MLNRFCTSDASAKHVHRLSKIESLEYAWGPYRIHFCLPMYSQRDFAILSQLYHPTFEIFPQPIDLISCAFEMDLIATRFQGVWDEQDQLIPYVSQRPEPNQVIGFVRGMLRMIEFGYSHEGACRSEHYLAINSCSNEIVIPTWFQVRKLESCSQRDEQLGYLRKTYESLIEQAELEIDSTVRGIHPKWKHLLRQTRY